MPTSEAPADPGSPTPSPAAVAVPRRSILRSLLRLGLLAGLFAGALVGSWQFRLHSTDDADPADLPNPIATTPVKNLVPGTPVEILARGDQALLRHRFAESLLQYTPLVEADSTKLPLVEYRIGLCHESLGQTDKAITCYRKGLDAAPPLSFACSLAMARCLLLQNHPLEARRLLYPVLLDEARQQALPTALVSEARFLCALALARETHPTTTDRLALDRLATFTDAVSEIPLHLEETARPPEPPKSKKAEPEVAAMVVQKRTDKQPAMVLSVEQLEKPAKELFGKLASDAGLRVEWTEQAKRQVEDRLLNLNVHNWPLQDLFELAADGIDLSCRLDGDVLRFSTREEIGFEKTTILRREMAQRALLAAVVADASHALAPEAQLELGNAAAAAGRPLEAIQWYDRLVHVAPASGCVVFAHYNRAQLHLRAQAVRHARRDFFRVIDHAPAHEYALRAYLRIGQLCLDEEDAREAIMLLRRAQTLAPGSAYQPLATLNLAAVYLSLGQPDQARATLEKHRAILHQDPYKPTAAFLDAYARLLLAKGATSTRRESTDLLSTLWHNKDATLLGSFGQFLIAEAYGELGFFDQAERLLRQASASTSAQRPLATCLECKLGEAILKQNQPDKARPLLEKVAATTSRHRIQARFQLARLDLIEKRWTDCAEKCRQLWEEQLFQEPLILLQLWGSALEGLGDHAKAAQCYAGKAPK